jgi:hypothetical protein
MGAQRNALLKDWKISAFHTIEDFLVNGAHDARGQESIEVGPWRNRRREACPRLSSLVAHEGFESSAILPIEDFLFAHAEAGKVILRQINPALAGILSDVAQDICELQGVAKVHGIGFALGILATEDFYRNQSHRTGNTPAVEFQVGKVLESTRLDIRGAAFDDLGKN